MTPNPNIAKCETCKGEQWVASTDADWPVRRCPDCRPSQPVGDDGLLGLDRDELRELIRNERSHTAHLEADLAAQKAGWAVAFRLGIHHQDRAEKLEARVAELEGALKKYGWHDHRCGAISDHSADVRWPEKECTCGFDDALTPAKKET